jgi:hypothetical protein
MLLVVQMFRLAWFLSLQHARQAGAAAFSRALTAWMLVCALVFLGVLGAASRGGGDPGDPGYVKRTIGVVCQSFQ